MLNIVDRIIAMEWNMFDKVQNIDGRAPCQDDKTTFDIMRSSQLAAWTPQLQESYYHDLQDAQRAGRNLLSEKYGYMMERTDPVAFQNAKAALPPRAPEKDALIVQICDAHVLWLETLRKTYPHLVGRGRAIRREDDSPAVTSFETYLWGELATYSQRTIELYAAYVEKLLQNGENLNAIILQNTVIQYGFGSLEEAEERLSQRNG